MQKITPWGLNFLLSGSLSGTPFFEEILSKLRFQAEDDGSIKTHQVDNLKSSIKVAMRMSATNGNSLSGKLRGALTALLDYGTAPSSDNIRAFLASDESRHPLVITELEEDSSDIKIVDVLQPFFKEGVAEDRAAIVDELNLIICLVAQDFSPA